MAQAVKPVQVHATPQPFLSGPQYVPTGSQFGAQEKSTPAKSTPAKSGAGARSRGTLRSALAGTGFGL